MKAKNYRGTDGMAYTRAEFIHGVPQCRITKYSMGSYRNDYTHVVDLVSDADLRVRDMALESARVALGKIATSKLGENFFMEIKAHPHHVLRENKMIFGAHADRLQEGMRRAFGKAIGRAARIRPGDTVFRVLAYAEGVQACREAMESASKKLPGTYRLEVHPLRENPQR